MAVMVLAALQTDALVVEVVQAQLAQMEQAPLVETGALVQHHLYLAPL
jgi:hypothetical protein